MVEYRGKGLQLSDEAQEAMRGDFILAGEEGAPVTTAADVGTYELISPPSFETELAIYLDPTQEMEADHQLHFTTGFWARIGYKVPDLKPAQLEKMRAAHEANPGLRILPTPLQSNGAGMVAIVNKARDVFDEPRESAEKCFVADEDALCLPSGYAYGKILDAQNLDDRASQEGSYYVMRFHDPANLDGAPITHTDLVKSLLKSGDAFYAPRKKSAPWTLPLLDVRSNVPMIPSDDSRELYDKVNPILFPETLIALHALYAVNGSHANRNAWSDLANAGIHRVTRSGKDMEMTHCASIAWESVPPRYCSHKSF